MQLKNKLIKQYKIQNNKKNNKKTNKQKKNT